ncbi:cytochrome c family protein [Neomegalonema sp.]|uniref:c-type cytochrome n=1 Tax=Neomegalonema sp. TaxID=2039713 RepID=UPI00263593B7|nr:cytochrome c family protein [Neomegalonema sp.]MDD2868002.1 cytochrome c family protein [Neomegalonema sp.]
MDSLEFSKILGAGCVALLVYVGMSEIAGAMYAGHKLETPAYSVEEAEAASAGPAEEVAPIAARLQTADLAAGEKAFGACKSCHTVSSDGKNSTGPGLWELVNREIGTHAGFSYSSAMAEKAGQHWDWDHLDAFLTNPKAYAPGTKMSYAGLRNPQARANLIAWLNTQGPSPAPLPEAPAAGEAPAAPVEH